MLVTSSSQEIRKYSMFAAIFYWDYPPLHQSSAELVLCGLVSSMWEISTILILHVICLCYAMPLPMSLSFHGVSHDFPFVSRDPVSANIPVPYFTFKLISNSSYKNIFTMRFNVTKLAILSTAEHLEYKKHQPKEVRKIFPFFSTLLDGT